MGETGNNDSSITPVCIEDLQSVRFFSFYSLYNSALPEDVLNEKKCIKPEDYLQTKIRNYGLVVLGTSTIIYTMYLFCCEKHLGSLSF
jgi:hypothetical protein